MRSTLVDVEVEPSDQLGGEEIRKSVDGVEQEEEIREVVSLREIRLCRVVDQSDPRARGGRLCTQVQRDGRWDKRST